MIDKEKIEKGLRCCIKGDHCNSVECPYYDAAPNIQGCTQALCQDVLALLKEQDAEIRQLKLAIEIMKGNGIRVDTEGR